MLLELFFHCFLFFQISLQNLLNFITFTTLKKIKTNYDSTARSTSTLNNQLQKEALCPLFCHDFSILGECNFSFMPHYRLRPRTSASSGSKRVLYKSSFAPILHSGRPLVYRGPTVYMIMHAF